MNAPDGDRPVVLPARARAVLDDLTAQGIGEEVAGWRDNAVVSGQTVTGADQRQFATSVIHHRLRHIAERDISNGITALSAAEDALVVQAALDDLFGAGMLERLLADPLVENIDAIGCDRVLVSYADGRKELGPPLWPSDKAMEEHLRRLGARTGQTERRFDHARPQLDLQLPGGARLFAVMAATKRPNMSVRRHRIPNASLTDLGRGGMFEVCVGDIVGAAVEAQLNVIVSGGTNAGKTTFARAMCARTGKDERIITIEDNRELNLDEVLADHLDIVSMESRDANTEGEGELTMADLVRMALRMNPSRVILGEVRGREVIPMLNAMSQGNDGSMCTIHASSSEGVFDRIASYCIQAPERLDRVAANLLVANAIDLVIFISQAATPDGRRRWVSSIREVVGAEDHLVISNEIFRAAPGCHAAPTGVPLRPATAERLAAVGYTLPSPLQAAS